MRILGFDAVFSHGLSGDPPPLPSLVQYRQFFFSPHEPGLLLRRLHPSGLIELNG